MKRLLIRGFLVGVLSAVVAVGPASAGGPTAVTCGSTITAPGDYELAGDCAGPGITIATSHVHLKLSGHTMSGPAFTGISARSVSDLHIEGPGTVTNYTFGLLLERVTNSHVEKVMFTNNNSGAALESSNDNELNNNVSTEGAFGLFVVRSARNDINNNVVLNTSVFGIVIAGSTDTHVDNNIANGNASGIVFSRSSFNHINGNTANNNQQGIVIEEGSSGNKIHGNTARGNTVFDLEDDNPGCDSNDWDGNHFSTANQPCIH